MEKWLHQEDIKMFKKVIVFAGTTEGRKIISYLCEKKIQTIGCIATEYGETLLEESPYLTSYAKRLTKEDMHVFFQAEMPDIILDATHPFATEVTQNIVAAAKESGISYMRLLRDEVEIPEALYFEKESLVADYLMEHEGNVLLTTGSKNLFEFTKVKDYEKRFFARVLSLPTVVESCHKLGFCGKNLFAMQGPFSEELNYAMLKEINARYLVTKASGVNGGIQEKQRAAKRAGVTLLVIKRPLESGQSLNEVKEYFDTETVVPVQKRVPIKICCVGIGMGNAETLTTEAKEILQKSSYLIGAKRVVDAVPYDFAEKEYAITAEEICDKIQKILIENEKKADIKTNIKDSYTIAVVFSGDSGFYSGTKRFKTLWDTLQQEKENQPSITVSILPGISSLSYFAAKANVSWEDAKITSLHGKEDNVLKAILEHEKVFTLFGKTKDLSTICNQLAETGHGSITVVVGENLSYPDEKITRKQAQDLTTYETQKLCVAFFLNSWMEKRVITPGIEDEEFIRAKVPMTKQEVRTIAISKLKLTKNAVFYDIGAGTGSIAIEVERLLENGKVFAIERKKEAIALIHENKIKFHANRLEIVEGTAPFACEDLEPPTHAFIGGSSGNLREIISMLFAKNEQVKIVVTAISLETIAETLMILKELEIQNPDIAYITVAKAKEVSHYHMMSGQNPVAVFSFSKQR